MRNDVHTGAQREDTLLFRKYTLEKNIFHENWFVETMVPVVAAAVAVLAARAIMGGRIGGWRRSSRSVASETLPRAESAAATRGGSRHVLFFGHLPVPAPRGGVLRVRELVLQAA